ncbi:Scr1 family TA system antitoxin-like transcriptional regulator [Amycolatopsis sp. NPDC003865]
MTKTIPCLPARLALSTSLRDARTAADFGLRRLAAKLGISAQNLSLWETGKTAPAIADLAHVLGFLRVSPEEYSRVMQLRRQLDDPISLETLDARSASRRRALEELAVHTFEWAPHVVPEPLQAPDDIDLAVFSHEVRRLELGRNGHRTVLLGAATLGPANGPQLQALRAVADLPGMEVRILPLGVEKIIEPFTIYDGGGGVFTVALRHHDNLIFVRDPDTVQRYRATFDALVRESLTCAGFRAGKPCERS